MKKRKKLITAVVSVAFISTLSSCTIVEFNTSSNDSETTSSDISTESEITSEEITSIPEESSSQEVSSIVEHIPVSNLYISEDSFSLLVGKTKQLYAQIFPSNATIKDVEWTSSNPDVMTVDSSGLVTGIGGGEATLTCVSQDDNNVTDAIEVSVYEDGSGFVKTSLNANVQNLNLNLSESLGEQNVLIVPIHVSDISDSESWTEDDLEQLDEIIFDEDSPSSYVSYYKKASNGRLIMSGEVSDIYSTEYTKSELEGSWSYIYDLFDNAVEWLDENDPTIDIANDYDKNGDGYIDNIHFVFDATSSVWGSSLWPHMSQTGNEPSQEGELPAVNTYSLSNIDHMDDAYTTIHEQGHIFGLQDYYNYSTLSEINGKQQYVDYVGSLDMQSNTCFDWNIYSKMNMGWVDPYYFNGLQESATITIGPASSTGDCIVLADNWNGNAFDEYITIELFSDVGNNSLFWNSGYFSQFVNTGGIRLSHVDSRLVDSYGNDAESPSDPYTSYNLKYSNSVDSNDYYGYSYNDDYHLLQVIQAGGTDTFTKPTINYRDLFLTDDDLFQTGDIFSMEKYGEEFFANKTTFNNGDEFPYVVSFDEVTSDSATITVTKI